MSSRTVVLLSYPVTLGMSAVEHVQDWMREFQLMALSDDTGRVHDVPERLRTMARQLSQQHAADLFEPDRARSAAAARGEQSVDLTYVVPAEADAEPLVRRWQQILEDVDDYCRAQDLLTLQRSPAQVALNDWVLREFLAQLNGEPPRPWTCQAVPQG